MRIMTVKKSPAFYVLLALLNVSLSGCGFFFGDDGVFRNRENDYLMADNIPPLVLDESLDKSALGELYPVPPITESDFGYEADPENNEIPRPLPLSANMLEESVKIQRLGQQTWILMNVAPGEVWPRVRHFLNVNGLAVASSDISSGVIETDWIQFKTDLSTYDKYRIQIDQGVQPDTSEIHIVHLSVPTGATPPAPVNWPQASVNAEKEKWLLDELAATLASDTTEGGTSLLAQSIGGSTKANLGILRNEPVMRLKLDRARALGTLSHAVKQEGFSPYESDAATGIFYVHYRKIDPDGPGWFSRKWSGIRNAKWVTAIFGQPEDELIKLKSPYTLEELTAHLPQGAALDQAPLSNRKKEQNLPDAPGYLVIVSGEEGNLVVRVRDPYGKRLEPRKAREMLTILRKNLI